MAKAKYLSNDKKSEISKLFHEGNLSPGSIADKLGISRRSVHRYKNYDGMNDLTNSPSEPIISNDDPYTENTDDSYDTSDEIYTDNEEKHGGSGLLLPIVIFVCLIALIVAFIAKAKGIFGSSDDKVNLDDALYGL
jgi:hypothetical protein